MTDPGMDLDARLEEYLRIRRSLGYKLERDGKLLAQFIAWLHEQHAAAVTVEHAVAWVSLPAAAGSGWLRFRMSVVRGFTAYLHTLDPAVPVPPAGLFPPGPHRAVPYLYSADELAALLTATDTLRYPLQRATYRTLISLLAVTGLRVGEGIRLNDADLDDEHGVLTVTGKFDKLRQVPLHPSSVAALRAYQRQRRAAHPRPSTPTGTPLGVVPTPPARSTALGGRRGYAPCRVVSAGGGRVGRLFVRIIPAAGVTGPASRASR
jgi:integrase/recombinase XerD